MSLARIRVEAKNYNPHASGEERERNFKGLFFAFNKQCDADRIKRTYKQRQTYEKPSEKKRRKQRESELALLKLQWQASIPDNHRRD